MDIILAPDVYVNASVALGSPPEHVVRRVLGHSEKHKTTEWVLARVEAMLHSLPETLLDEAHDPVGARSIIYALLWSDDTDVQRTQQRALESGDPQALSRLAAIRKPITTLPSASRLPLAELAVPAMRLMPKAQYARFRKTLQALIEADSEINLFEFALGHMIIRHVEPAFGQPDKAPVKYRKLDAILPACKTVLAGLAAWGSSDKGLAQVAYETGLNALGQPAAAMPPGEISLQAVSDALDRLSQASPTLKRRVVDACAACIKADGVIAGDEADLLRAIADAMDIPMPPLA